MSSLRLHIESKFYNCEASLMDFNDTVIHLHISARGLRAKKPRQYTPLRIRLNKETQRLAVYESDFFDRHEFGLRRLILDTAVSHDKLLEIQRSSDVDAAEIGVCAKLIYHKWDNTVLQACLYDGYALDLCDPNSIPELERAIIQLGGVLRGRS